MWVLVLTLIFYTKTSLIKHHIDYHDYVIFMLLFHALFLIGVSYFEWDRLMRYMWKNHPDKVDYWTFIDWGWDKSKPLYSKECFDDLNVKFFKEQYGLVSALAGSLLFIMTPILFILLLMT
jgi:hypothetical protein